ncbi:MAG: hypothetical protein M5R41_05545 [Bacteroidia bacterium]|nr:hypothetical protein [Bacteroidia bacterium]
MRWMKLLSWICAAVLLTAVTSFGRDQTSGAIQLEEIDQDGRKWIMQGAAPIVDINSTLHIRLDLSEIRRRLAVSFPVRGFPEEELERLIVLQQAARQGLAVLPDVAVALKTLVESAMTPQDLKAFEQAMDPAATIGDKILEIANADAATFGVMVERRLEKAGPSTHDTYRLVFEAAAEYTAQLTDTLDARIANEAVYIALGAWMRTGEGSVPLHLAGFDAYPQGEFYEIPRWNVVLTEEQKKQLDRSAALAKEYNAGRTDVQRMLESMLAQTFTVVRETIEGCAGGLRGTMDTLLSEAGGIGGSAREELSKLKAEITQYADIVSGLHRKYTGAAEKGDATVWLQAAVIDVHDLANATKRLAQHIAALADERGILATLGGLNARTAERVRDLRRTLLTCVHTAITPIHAILDQVRYSGGLAHSGDNITAQALAFGALVTRHDIAQLPAETTLDLRYTGKRAPGDAVVIRLGAARVDPAAGKGETATDLYTTTIQLYQVVSHIETTVGLVFVDPLGVTEVQRRFQAAPSYSVLLKAGSRSSALYNRLINPGIGLNVSALYFDKDDVPEPGIAIVGSIFRDYLQAGFGYNLFLDTPYWFFGTSLPLLNIPIPGAGTAGE